MKCIIIHGCPSTSENDPAKRTYDKHWIPWTKKQLESRGIPTETPLMPEPWAPNYEAFKKEFEKHEVTEDTVLVGHSCGTAFLVRWLGETKQKIKKLILVGPWKVPDSPDAARQEFYGFPIDETIPSRVDEIIMFTSDTEYEEGKESLKIYQAVFDGEIIDLPRHGHYTMRSMGTEELPELIEAIIK